MFLCNTKLNSELPKSSRPEPDFETKSILTSLRFKLLVSILRLQNDKT